MHLEQTIHNASDITLSLVQGESVRWTSFIVDGDDVSLEFSAFGDLPIKLRVFDDEPIVDLVEYLAMLGGRIDAANNARRAAEKACKGLRDRMEAAQDRESEATERALVLESQLADANSEIVTWRDEAGKTHTDIDGSIA